MCVFTGDVNVCCYGKVVSAGLLHYRITIFPFVGNKYFSADHLKLCKSCIKEGHQEDMTTSLTHKLDQGNWRLPTPSLPWNVYSTCLLFSQELLQEYNLEIAIW